MTFYSNWKSPTLNNGLVLTNGSSTLHIHFTPRTFQPTGLSPYEHLTANYIISVAEKHFCKQIDVILVDVRGEKETLFTLPSKAMFFKFSHRLRQKNGFEPSAGICKPKFQRAGKKIIPSWCTRLERRQWEDAGFRLWLKSQMVAIISILTAGWNIWT